MNTQCIPANTSVVVTEDGNCRRSSCCDNDNYTVAERVKDSISRSDLANANYAHQASDDAGMISRIVGDKGSAVIDAVSNVATKVCDSTSLLNTAIFTSSSASQLATERGFAASQLATERGFQLAADRAAVNTNNISNMLIGGFKDARFDTASSTAALQASICQHSKEVALAFAHATHHADKNHCDLAKQMAECCCALKEKITGVTDAMKQNELDNLRQEMLQLKIEASCSRGHGHRNGPGPV